MTNLLLPVVFRVENPVTGNGLWFNEAGKRTDFITTIPGAQSANMPMPFNENVAGGWYSACDSLEVMKNWFSFDDIVNLHELGYGLYRFQVTHLKEHNGHAVFRREESFVTELPIVLLQGKC